MRQRLSITLALTLTFTIVSSPLLGLASTLNPASANPAKNERPVRKPESPKSGYRKPKKSLDQPAGQTTTLLPGGRVLVIGGIGPDGKIASSAISDPVSGETTPLDDNFLARAWHSATMLPDGRVLIIGGVDAKGQLVKNVGIFDPASHAYQQIKPQSLMPRAYHSATLLTDGRVLIVGGSSAKGVELLKAELWSFKTQTSRTIGESLAKRLKGKGTLLSDGNILIEGGFDENGKPVANKELFNSEAESLSLTTIFSDRREAETPFLAGSFPRDGATDVELDDPISLRFSQPLRVESLNSEKFELTGDGSSIGVKIVPAEAGSLIFLSPAEQLKKGATYTVNVRNTSDGSRTITPAVFTFTTAGKKDDSNQFLPSQSLGDVDWAPNAENLRGDWSTKAARSSWQDQPALQAKPGETALSGQVLTLRGEPLVNVTISIDGKETRTDTTGRFLISDVSSGHKVMIIDGRSASRPSATYGIFRAGVDLKPRETNVLPYTIWMPKLDMAHATTIPSPNRREIVITNPLIPGLELHLPAGTLIRDLDGRPVTQISITPVPTDRPPFPLPPGFNVPVFASIQPGGARVIPPRARLIYPNYTNRPSGARINFWNYDPEGKGWYIYGQGTVSTNGKQIIPDAGVVIYEFTGIMIGDGGDPAGTGPRSGNGPGNNDGEPVDLGTGLFVYSKTDLAVADVLPVALHRTYRPEDNTSRAFGIGSTHPYDMFLWSINNYHEVDLILPDGGRVHYVRISPGTSYADAIYEHSDTPSAFHKSRISWNGTGWELRLKDGTIYVFPEFAPLQAIRDRNGNQITITRTGFNITQITSPSGRWIQFIYDSSNRVAQAKDNAGRTVNYQYDTGGRLWKVTNPAGGVTEYTYDSGNRMITLKDARGIVYLTNEYNSAGRVIKQTQADNSTFQFAYTLDANGKITQTDVTDPRNNVHRVTFNADGYTTSEIRALGKPEQQTYSYQRQAGTNLLIGVIDPLSRTTSFTYDAVGNVTSVTKLAGTSAAVTTAMTYEPIFNQVTSVTDPLNHTASYAYDSRGNLITITDPLNHQTTIAYSAAGEPLSVTDPLQHVVQFTYDNGNLVTMTDPLGRTINRLVDAVGRATTTINPLGQRTQSEYNALNQRTRITDSLQGVTAFGYDANGNLLSVTDALNHVSGYVYDNMDRATTRRDPLLHEETYQYDLIGNLTQVTDRKGQITAFTYDALNRLTQVTYDDASTTTYQYDSGNRLTSIVDSLSGTITLNYDNLDRLTQEITPEGSISYTYDNAGRRSSMTVSGQTTVNYNYDNANRLTEVTRGGASVTFTYDSADRRTKLTLANGVNAEFTYDAASQLTDLTYKKGSDTLGNLSYSYDAAGRRTALGGSYARTGMPQGITTATYNAANQQTAFGDQLLTYDLNGNLSNDGSNTYTWNSRDQLVSITGGTTASFAYDAFGRRVTRTANGTSTSFLYDGLNITQELSGTTPSANLLNGRIDEIFMRNDSSETSHLLVDGLGSTVAETDSGGVLTTQYTYEPFGATSLNGTASANSSQYTGRENDESGLYFYRARYYSPTLQRFISEDPIGFRGGDINLYAYTSNNPTNARDPSGELVPLLVAAAGAVVLILMYSKYANAPGPTDVRYNNNPAFDMVGDIPYMVAGGVVIGKFSKWLRELPAGRTPGNYPKPPGWTQDWEWRIPEGTRVKPPRWFDPQGGEWRWHPPDKWHSKGHWDYNPWSEWNSPWQNKYQLLPFLSPGRYDQEQ